MIYIKRLNTCVIKIPKTASCATTHFLYENVCTEEDVLSKIFTWTGTEYARIYHKNSPPLPHSHVDSTYVIEHNIVPKDAHFIGVIRNPFHRQLSLYLHRIRDSRYPVKIPSPKHFRSLIVNGVFQDKPQQAQPQTSFITKDLKHTYWLHDNLEQHLLDFCKSHDIEVKSPLRVINKSPGDTAKLIDVFYDDSLKEEVYQAYKEDFELYYSLLEKYK